MEVHVNSTKVIKKANEKKARKKIEKIEQAEKHNVRMNQLDKNLSEIALGVDQKLMKLSTQIEQLNSQFNLEKDGDEFIAEMQNKNFESFLREQDLYLYSSQML